MDPQHAYFHLVIGRGYSALGDLDMALAYFERARRLSTPQDQEIQVEILVSEAVAWLGSTEDQAVHKATEKFEQSENNSRQRNAFEASLALASGRAADWMAKYEQQKPKCLVLQSIEERAMRCPLWLDLVFQELGDHQSAQALNEKRLENSRFWWDIEPSWTLMPNYMMELAILGREDEALDVLDELIHSGWRGHWNMHTNYVSLGFLLQRDVSFDGIRDHPRFQTAVAVIEADMAEQLENVREMERRGEIPTLEELRAELSDN